MDAAFKGAEDNDFVAITVWGKRRNDYYLRYCLNRHLDFPGTLAAIRTVQGCIRTRGPCSSRTRRTDRRSFRCCKRKCSASPFRAAGREGGAGERGESGD